MQRVLQTSLGPWKHFRCDPPTVGGLSLRLVESLDTEIHALLWGARGASPDTLRPFSSHRAVRSLLFLCTSKGRCHADGNLPSATPLDALKKDILKHSAVWASFLEALSSSSAVSSNTHTCNTLKLEHTLVNGW